MKRSLLLACTFLMTLSFSAQGSVTGKVLDVLVSQSNLEKFFGKAGIDSVAVQRRGARSLLKALGTFESGGTVPTTGAALSKLLAKLEEKIATEAGADVALRNADLARITKLKKLLAKEVGDMSATESKEVLNEVFDNFILLAGRHGVGMDMALVCGGCVGEELAAHGFKYVLSSINDSAVKKGLAYFSGKSPTQVRRYIRRHIRGMGSFATASAKIVSPAEEETLAVFIWMAKKGSPATDVQRDFIEAILKVSKDAGGETNLLDPKNPHKLWKLFEKDMDPALMKEWTAMLNDVAEESKNTANKKEAFFNVLERLAKDDAFKQEQVATLRAKGCYFP